MKIEESDDISTIKSALWTHISQAINLHQNGGIEFHNVHKIPGGDINTSWRLVSDKISFFVKLNSLQLADAHRCEKQGLHTIANTNCIKTPAVVTCGAHLGYSYLVLEHLSLQQMGDEFSLGKQLAQLHRNFNPKGQKCFGFSSDNFIGFTEQKNTYTNDWLEFWVEQRLKPQIDLIAKTKRHPNVVEKVTTLTQQIDAFFNNHSPSASLLHGDLWSGNVGFTQGQACIFDPAVYYGDRETDIAFTELFGGFGQEFYRGYQSTWPLDKSYPQRKPLYNLYHLLNHLNMFGEAYLNTCMQTLDQLLCSLK